MQDAATDKALRRILQHQRIHRQTVLWWDFPGGSGIRLAQCQHGVHESTFTKEAGYDLIFEDGQQKQANQIRAIRTFIQQEVDYIVLAPVTETGWDTVLREAKDAGIPVVIVDRKVDVEDDSLFTCFVGSDFELEGLKMSEWLNSFSISKGIAPEDLHIVNIQGNIGASAQIGRTRGLEQGAAKYGWDLLDQVSGEFTQAKGKEVMEAFLKNTTISMWSIAKTTMRPLAPWKRSGRREKGSAAIWRQEIL